MIFGSAPVLVLDDDPAELMSVVVGLGVCDVPVTPVLVSAGSALLKPLGGFSGVRLLVTDLHILGPTQSKVAQYGSALVALISQLVRPSYYILIFWSNYEAEAAEATEYLRANLPAELMPIGFASLSKQEATDAADDEDVRITVRGRVGEILDEFPQIKALMDWEAAVSHAGSETTNQLFRVLVKSGIDPKDPASVKTVLGRMAQEAVGAKRAIAAGSKGLVQAFLPILQDQLERDSHSSLSSLSKFLDIRHDSTIKLPVPQVPGAVSVTAVLNDFFVHDEQDGTTNVDRGAVIRLGSKYLASTRFWQDFGLSVSTGDWREVVCSEFYIGWPGANEQEQRKSRELLARTDVYAVELSAVCDYAQDKRRSLRYLFALFVRSGLPIRRFLNGKTVNNESIYVTPEVSLRGVPGRFLISCRVFASRTYGQPLDGECVTRLRKDVVDELSHHYSTHMRRPGKIAFY